MDDGKRRHKAMDFTYTLHKQDTPRVCACCASYLMDTIGTHIHIWREAMDYKIPRTAIYALLFHYYNVRSWTRSDFARTTSLICMRLSVAY